MSLLERLVPEIDTSWMARGACREAPDPTLWFPPRGDSSMGRDAKAICHGCEVRFECLEYALEAGERWGIWGGTSERERRRLRRTRAQARRKAA